MQVLKGAARWPTGRAREVFRPLPNAMFQVIEHSLNNFTLQLAGVLDVGELS